MRITIRGIGAVFPGGVGKDALLRVLHEGSSRIQASRTDPEVLASEIGESLKPLVNRKGLAALSRAALLAAAGIEDLLKSVPGLLPEKSPGECALVVGTAFGHVESKADFNREAHRDGVRLVSPILFPNTIINSLAGHAAILFKLSGPNSTVTSGRRSGLEAILRAASLLRAGRAARAVAVGCDEVSVALLRALRAAGQTVPASGDLGGTLPSAAVVPGEAAIALLLEAEEEPASAPRVNGECVPAAPHGQPSGVILGAGERNAVGTSLRDAVADAMRAALRDAGVAAESVAWLALSAGGVHELDRAEAEAVNDVFGPGKPCAVLKRVFGETFGAAGVLGVAVAALSFEAGLVPRAQLELVVGSGPRPSAFVGVPLRPGIVKGGPVLVSAVDETGATCALVAPA